MGFFPGTWILLKVKKLQNLLRNDGVRTRNEQLRTVDKETEKVVLILTTESQKGIAVNRSM